MDLKQSAYEAPWWMRRDRKTMSKGPHSTHSRAIVRIEMSTRQPVVSASIKNMVLEAWSIQKLVVARVTRCSARHRTISEGVGQHLQQEVNRGGAHGALWSLLGCHSRVLSISLFATASEDLDRNMLVMLLINPYLGPVCVRDQKSVVSILRMTDMPSRPMVLLKDQVYGTALLQNAATSCMHAARIPRGV